VGLEAGDAVREEDDGVGLVCADTRVRSRDVSLLAAESVRALTTEQTGKTERKEVRDEKRQAGQGWKEQLSPQDRQEDSEHALNRSVLVARRAWRRGRPQVRSADGDARTTSKQGWRVSVLHCEDEEGSEGVESGQGHKVERDRQCSCDDSQCVSLVLATSRLRVRDRRTRQIEQTRIPRAASTTARCGSCIGRTASEATRQVPVDQSVSLAVACVCFTGSREAARTAAEPAAT